MLTTATRTSMLQAVMDSPPLVMACLPFRTRRPQRQQFLPASGAEAPDLYRADAETAFLACTGQKVIRHGAVGLMHNAAQA